MSVPNPSDHCNAALLCPTPWWRTDPLDPSRHWADVYRQLHIPAEYRQSTVSRDQPDPTPVVTAASVRQYVAVATAEMVIAPARGIEMIRRLGTVDGIQTFARASGLATSPTADEPDEGPDAWWWPIAHIASTQLFVASLTTHHGEFGQALRDASTCLACLRIRRTLVAVPD